MIYKKHFYRSFFTAILIYKIRISHKYPYSLLQHVDRADDDLMVDFLPAVAKLILAFRIPVPINLCSPQHL